MTLCPFNRIIVVGSFLGSVSFPTVSSWPDLLYQGCVLSCGMGLKSDQKVVGYFYNIYVDLYCNPRGSWLVKLFVILYYLLFIIFFLQPS